MLMQPTLRLLLFCLVFAISAASIVAQPGTFVSVKSHTLVLNKEPYYFVGVNYL